MSEGASRKKLVCRSNQVEVWDAISRSQLGVDLRRFRKWGTVGALRVLLFMLLEKNKESVVRKRRMNFTWLNRDSKCSSSEVCDCDNEYILFRTKKC